MRLLFEGNDFSFSASGGAATIRGQRLFRSALPEVRLLFEGSDYFVQRFRRCGYYSRAATNQRNTVHIYIRNTLPTQLLIKEGDGCMGG